MNWPQSRDSHVTTIISDHHVMTMGGYSGGITIADSWLFNIDAKTWTKVSY